MTLAIVTLSLNEKLIETQGLCLHFGHRDALAQTLVRCSQRVDEDMLKVLLVNNLYELIIKEIHFLLAHFFELLLGVDQLSSQGLRFLCPENLVVVDELIVGFEHAAFDLFFEWLRCTNHLQIDLLDGIIHSASLEIFLKIEHEVTVVKDARRLLELAHLGLMVVYIHHARVRPKQVLLKRHSEIQAYGADNRV